MSNESSDLDSDESATQGYTRTQASDGVAEISCESDDDEPLKAKKFSHAEKLQTSKAGKGRISTSRNSQLTVSEGGLAVIQNTNAPIKIDLNVIDGGDSIRRKFGTAMKVYPLFIGQRPSLSDMTSITVYSRDKCGRVGWQREFEEAICAHSPAWKSNGRNFLYLPGCTVFVDEQRPVVFAPKTQEKPEWRLSLRSHFDSFYGKDVELFFDNGPGSDDQIFYAGKYRCHRLNALHPAGFIHSQSHIPWTLKGVVLDSQEPGYGHRLRMKDAFDLIYAERIIYEFMGLQCVGFDVAFDCALTGEKSWTVARSLIAKVPKDSTPEVKDTKKRRIRDRDEDSSDSGEDVTVSVKKRKSTRDAKSKAGSSSRKS
ncbi:hypothetical protein PQX77_002938 [Marasmius sp. AFHP31]|nr:hypothetical protein PQX77_002938 [Marasmius sp. AFHP31]